ncbi:Hypothetical predicted protein, partial [Olea europaea subsp. europaea]
SQRGVIRQEDIAISPEKEEIAPRQTEERFGKETSSQSTPKSRKYDQPPPQFVTKEVVRGAGLGHAARLTRELAAVT